MALEGQEVVPQENLSFYRDTAKDGRGRELIVGSRSGTTPGVQRRGGTSGGSARRCWGQSIHTPVQLVVPRGRSHGSAVWLGVAPPRRDGPDGDGTPHSEGRKRAAARQYSPDAISVSRWRPAAPGSPRAAPDHGCFCGCLREGKFILHILNDNPHSKSHICHSHIAQCWIYLYQCCHLTVTLLLPHWGLRYRRIAVAVAYDLTIRVGAYEGASK